MRLLVSVGRHAAIADLGLETVGLDPTARSVAVDARMRAAPGLWAIGDMTGHGAFTHVSMYEGRIAGDDILGLDPEPADYRALPRVTFTDPEVASVGLSASQATERGIRVGTGLQPLGSTTRGWLHGPGGEGLIKVVADLDRRVLVGGTVVGPSGGEVLGYLAVAVHAEVPIATLRSMIFAYPTFHRGIEAALDSIHPD